MGTPSYVEPVLEALLSLDSHVVGVYTQTDQPSGRGRTYKPPPVKSFADERGIGVFQPTSLRRAEVQRELASLSPDVIVVAAYGKLLPPEVLRIPPFGCLNIHPSLLPRYRGPSPVVMTILEEEAYAGTTIMLMDEGMDTGPVLTQRAMQINPDAVTTEDLTRTLFQFGADLVKEVLPLWLKGEVTPQPQDPSQTTVTKKLEKKDGEARWHLSAKELERRSRAFTPWPGLFTSWEGQLLKILSAVPLSDQNQERGSVGVENLPPSVLESWGEPQPGLAVGLDEPGVAVGVVTGSGILGLRSLQLEGRRPLSSEEFVRGHRRFPGSRLPS